MTSFTLSSATTNYAYRADGMRVSKAAGTQTVTYGYDGQMGVEECLTDTGTSSNDYTTRYGIGVRGIDRIETTNSSGTSVGYPVYDAHGNMIATLAKSGASYSVGNLRSYDAWGGVRSGSTTGSPSGRYCANLGHLQDDESGLVYVRARYYEPASARFASEDSSRDGLNYFAYCNNNPVGQVDRTGNEGEQDALEMFATVINWLQEHGYVMSGHKFEYVTILAHICDLLAYVYAGTAAWDTGMAALPGALAGNWVAAGLCAGAFFAVGMACMKFVTTMHEIQLELTLADIDEWQLE